MRLASLKESDLMHSAEGIGGNERITMGDLLYSIDADKFGQQAAPSEDKVSKATGDKKDTTINTTKLRKQMKALKKEVEKAPTL